MAASVLKMTPEAELAAAVTGHLGPNAPSELDGLVFVAVVWRPRKGQTPRRTIRRVECRRSDSRAKRQAWVVEQVLALVAEELADCDQD